MHKEAHIVHGDVKLENIFLDPDKDEPCGYRVYLSDFGLAQEMDEEANGAEHDYDEVQEMPLSGSIPYCSPERLQALEPRLTEAMDAWGLGVVAYALVYSKLPFHDDYEPRLVMKILEAEIDWTTTGPHQEDALAASSTCCWWIRTSAGLCPKRCAVPGSLVDVPALGECVRACTRV